MPAHPSSPNKPKDPHATLKIVGFIGLTLAISWAITQSRQRITELTQKELAHAKSTPEEITYDKNAIKRYGGSIFTMSRLPEMAEESPNVKGRAYMRFPEKKDKTPRALVYFHGLGNRGWTGKNELKVIQYTKDMQEGGDPVILIAPENQSGRGEASEESQRWQAFDDPDTLANLIEFAERSYGKRIDNITLTSFSGGYLGVMKVLRALEKAKNKDSEAASLYERITRIAYMDSAIGVGSEHVAKWMAANPEASTMSCYNKRTQIYAEGSEKLREAFGAKKIDPKRLHIELMQPSQGHGIYEEYFKKFNGPKGD